MGTKSFVRYESKGICLIISPWNYPVLITLSGVISAIAAGNCAIVKPSEISSNSSAEIASFIRELFPENEVCCMLGGVEVSTELLKPPISSYILYREY